MPDADDWIAIMQTPAIDAQRCGALMRSELSADEAETLIAQARAAAPTTRTAWLRKQCAGLDVTLLTPVDHAWPERLRNIPDPPAALFLRGDPALLSRPQLAVVGARRATRRGLADARLLVEELVAAGLVITSGLALGIDGAAHAAALDADGGTIAVLGAGIDRIYPPRHVPLARRIGEAGLIVSEFPPGVPPLAHHFPRRNRIISGLALGVLVVEASERSGSMISARLAAAQGRDVFAVPGTMRDPNAAGCHRLIREGAVLVRSAQDVLEELGWACAAADQGARAAGGSGTAAESRPAAAGRARDACPVLAAIDPEGTPFDLVLARTGLDVGALGVRLTELELDGCISREMDRLVRLV